jgi:hypothetical protein
VGRDYSEIEITAMAGVEVVAAAKDPDGVLRQAEMVAKLGVSHLILRNGSDPDLAAYDAIGRDLLPKLHAI